MLITDRLTAKGEFFIHFTSNLRLTLGGPLLGSLILLCVMCITIAISCQDVLGPLPYKSGFLRLQKGNLQNASFCIIGNFSL